MTSRNIKCPDRRRRRMMIRRMITSRPRRTEQNKTNTSNPNESSILDSSSMCALHPNIPHSPSGCLTKRDCIEEKAEEEAMYQNEKKEGGR
jgi:hypothetical protein